MDNIEKLLKQEQKKLSPTEKQEEIVFMRVFGRAPENSQNNIFNITNMIKMIFLKRMLIMSLALAGFATFIAVPVLYYSNNPSQQSYIDDISYDLKPSVPGDSINENQVKSGQLERSADRSIDNFGTPTVTYSGGITSGNVEEDVKTREDERAKIQTALFTLECYDIRDVFNTVKDIAAQSNGYIVSSNFYGASDSNSKIVFRVPADKLESTIDRIRGLDANIIMENVSSLDQQNELTEIIKIKTDLEDQIKDLETKLANETDQSKKDSLTKQIDSLKLQKTSEEDKAAKLEQTTSFSTVEVEFKNFKLKLTSTNSKDIWNSARLIASFWINVMIFLAIPTAIILVVRKLYSLKRK